MAILPVVMKLVAGYSEWYSFQLWHALDALVELGLSEDNIPSILRQCVRVAHYVLAIVEKGMP